MVSATMYPTIPESTSDGSEQVSAAIEPEDSDGGSDDDDEESDAESSPGGNGGGGDEYVADKMFIAIEGINESDLAQEDRDHIEKLLVQELLTSGYPIEDVRVSDDDAPIVEIRNNCPVN